MELARGSEKKRRLKGKREWEGYEERLWLPYAFTHLCCFFFCISSPLLFSPPRPDLSIYIVLCSDSWRCVADCETNHPLNYSGMCSWAVLWLISFPPISPSLFLFISFCGLGYSLFICFLSPVRLPFLQHSVQFNPIQFSSWSQIHWMCPWDFAEAKSEKWITFTTGWAICDVASSCVTERLLCFCL